MINRIYWQDKLIISSEKIGREKIFVLDDGTRINRNKLISEKSKILCNKCNKFRFVVFYGDLLKRNYICPSCHGSERTGHPCSQEKKRKISEANKGNKYWVGKKHTEETKKKLSDRMTGKLVGNLNPFYGKKHDGKTIELMVEKRKIWRENLTEEQKKCLSLNLSKSQKTMQKNDPDGYRENKRKGGLAAAKSVKKYQKNNFEKKLEQKLKEMQIEMKYSVIFCHKQFDFGNKEHKILLEAQGDYWHGNPNIYKELNEIQKRNVNKDVEKAKIAEKHGFKIFYIWEKEFNNGNFSVLFEIKNYLNNVKNPSSTEQENEI